jgi:hypothetical protein
LTAKHADVGMRLVTRGQFAKFGSTPMFDKPVFPPDQPWQIWAIVALCFVFWLVAYVLIIRWSFKEKTFGMPISALAGNIVWEGLFSHYFPPSFWLLQLGNTAWIGFDLLILIAAWKYGPDDFSDPFVKRWLRTMLILGMVVATWIEIPIVRVYNDVHGQMLGWGQALMMAILFIAMLLRRNSLKGQSIYIALAMVLGNIFAYLWCAYFPDTPPLLDPSVNRAFLVATGFFNVVYVVMIWQKSRALGVNPWKRLW